MDNKLIAAFKKKDYAYILKCLQPLFLKYLKGVPLQDQQEFLQEYYLVCLQTIERHHFDNF